MAEAEKIRLRVLRFLSRGAAKPANGSVDGTMLLDGGERGAISVERKMLASLIREGTLTMDSGRIGLASGTQSDNHRDLGAVIIDTGTGPETVAINWSESPLGQLMRRRGKSGEPFLSHAEFQAGERLRADYTRGQIMPRLGANWEASVSSGRRDGGIGDLTDAALAARMRVENAVRAVGPELSGVLIDVCCFLKGMETVEMEHGWPVRSAKIVLKTALGVLSRHYNPQGSTRQRAVLQWGTTDYRPSIG